MTSSKSPVQKYTSCLIYASVALAVLSSLGLWFWGGERVHKLWFILLLFMAITQWLVFAFTAKFAQHKPKTLLKQYQIAKYVKLFIYLIVLAVYVFVIKTNAITFLANFIVYYLVFTVLEVWFLHRWMNRLPQSPTHQH